MDIKSISTIFSPINSLVKDIWTFKLDKAVADRVMSLNHLISSAQSEMLDQQETITMLRRENDRLEKENLRLTDWNEQKKNYHLHEPISGSFVWRYRPNEEANQAAPQRTVPTHDLCPQCFENNKRSILQGFDHQGHRFYSQKCFHCGLIVHIDNPPKSTVAVF
ncbi:MAG: hypothetical protein VB141_11205 [Burkholderia gladioli]